MQLITKQNCHLCDDARLVVANVCSEFNEEFEELDVVDHPNLAAVHFEFLPVLLVDGVQVAIWRVEPQTLKTALSQPHL